jgi:RimJ/RimL family protein N-acetyltransferase
LIAASVTPTARLIVAHAPSATSARQRTTLAVLAAASASLLDLPYGAERQFGPFFLHRSEDDLVVGAIGGAFVDEEGTIEIGYAVVESQWNRGYATAAVEALIPKAREASDVRRIVAHTPVERP